MSNNSFTATVAESHAVSSQGSNQELVLTPIFHEEFSKPMAIAVFGVLAAILSEEIEGAVYQATPDWSVTLDIGGSTLAITLSPHDQLNHQITMRLMKGDPIDIPESVIENLSDYCFTKQQLIDAGIAAA